MAINIKPRNVVHKLSGDVSGALITIPLLLLLSLTVLQYGNQIIEGFTNADTRFITGIAVALSIGVATFFILVIRRQKSFNPFFFLTFSLLSAIFLYTVYAWSIDVAWVNDFKILWGIASQMVEQGDFTVYDLRNERALPVLVPLILLFGKNADLVPIVNIGMLLCIQLAGYDLARRISGHRAAQGFVILWLGAMEPVMALLIPSHDIWGLFYLVLFFWGFRALSDWTKSSPLSSAKSHAFTGLGIVVLAVLLTILDMQRELAPVLGIGFVLSGLMLWLNPDANRTGLRRTMVIAASVFVVTLSITIPLKQNGFMATSDQDKWLSALRIGGFGSSLSYGDYDQGWTFYEVFFKVDNESIREDLVYSVPLSDFALQPAARINNVIQRAHPLAELGSQNHFYQEQAQARWNWFMPLTRSYNVCFAIVIAILGLLIAPLLVRRLKTIDGMVQLSTLSALVGILLLIGESQPRYLFPLWFILPQLAAVTLAERHTTPFQTLTSSTSWGLGILRGTLILVVTFFLLSYGFRTVYDEKSGRILTDWKPGIEGAKATLPADWFEQNQKMSSALVTWEFADPEDTPQATHFGKLALVLKIPVQAAPGASTSAQKRVCATTNRSTIEFYYTMPHQNLQATKSYTLQVSINNQTQWQSELTDAIKIQRVSINNILPPNHCGSLEFRLIANDGQINTEWIKSAHVNIYFPRLAR